jgi:hypothetical protein
MKTRWIAFAGLMLAGVPASAQITSLPSPNAIRPDGRLGSFEASLAGDGDRLVVFYCEEEFFPLDATVTVVKEWNGNQWIDRGCDLSVYHNECRHPDVAVSGDLFSTAWQNDGGNVSWASNYENASVCTGSGYPGSYNEYDVAAAVAFGRPYLGYRTDESPPRVYVEFYEGPGPAPAHVKSCSSALGYAGDLHLRGAPDAWYLAYQCRTLSTCIQVVRGYYASPGQPATQELGPCFLGDTRTFAIGDVEVLGSRPVVVWRAEGASVVSETMAVAARYEPALSPVPWEQIGDWVPRAGHAFAASALSVSGSKLHMLLDERQIASPNTHRLLLYTWNGASWSGPRTVASGTDLRTSDIANFQGIPHVSYVDGNDGSVQVAAVPEPAAGAGGTAALLALMGLRICRVRRAQP